MTMACGLLPGMEKTMETDSLKPINKISHCLDTRGVVFLKPHKTFPISTDKFVMTMGGNSQFILFSLKGSEYVRLQICALT